MRRQRIGDLLYEILKSIEGYKLSCLTEGYSPNTMEGYDWALKKIETFLTCPPKTDHLILLGSVFGGQVKSTQDQHNRLIYK